MVAHNLYKKFWGAETLWAKKKTDFGEVSGNFGTDFNADRFSPCVPSSPTSVWHYCFTGNGDILFNL